VQQTQENCFLALAFLVLGTLLAPALADAAAAGPAKSDPLLTEAPGPCDPKLDGPDYVAGTDVDGNPVATADLSQAKIPAPNGVLLTLAGETGKGKSARPQAYAQLSQKDVDSILNPKPACPAARKAR
jgi:hypothetical protein